MRKKSAFYRAMAIFITAILTLCINDAIVLKSVRHEISAALAVGKAQAAQPQLNENVSGSTAQTEWYLTLVNRENPIPPDYEVTLLRLDNGEQIDSRIYPELQAMFDSARASGVYPVVSSGYRTADKQRELYDSKIAAYRAQGYSDGVAQQLAAQWVALPNTSEHQLGIAVDINADFSRDTNENVYAWLDKNAYKYGFIKRYPENKTELTGIGYEPWHYRYVGKTVAGEIYSRGLCLEEYLAS